MSGTPGRSGGHNRLSIEEHLVRGTLRADRHLRPLPAPPEPVTPADRRRVLRGLPPAARRIVTSLLAAYDGWDASTLELLRSYGLSCVRVEALQSAVEPSADLHRELRINLNLQRGLNLVPSK